MCAKCRCGSNGCCLDSAFAVAEVLLVIFFCMKCILRYFYTHWFVFSLNTYCYSRSGAFSIRKINFGRALSRISNLCERLLRWLPNHTQCGINTHRHTHT